MLVDMVSCGSIPLDEIYLAASIVFGYGSFLSFPHTISSFFKKYEFSSETSAVGTAVPQGLRSTRNSKKEKEEAATKKRNKTNCVLEEQQTTDCKRGTEKKHF